MKKILVGYCLSSDIKRSTRNKPEERQRIILDSLSKNLDFVTMHIDKICPDIHNVLNTVHDENYIRFLLMSYISFKADSRLCLTRDYEVLSNNAIGFIPN